jgi:hypothetical protein
MRYLLSTANNMVFEWDPILADNPLCVEISVERAFPERFMPKAATKRKTKLNFETPEVPEEFPMDPALSTQAAKGWPT